MTSKDVTSRSGEGATEEPTSTWCVTSQSPATVHCYTGMKKSQETKLQKRSARWRTKIRTPIKDTGLRRQLKSGIFAMKLFVIFL
uniref:uncharacterized protein LOC108950244 isoform X2 n=1 Tax=Ciona intestinalis TaxID=7719 RepID=UPI000EF540A5|nr:uncharacterized protein LOC108950244 isoform X2 [Ciona intestinalis]|eukprot:XP_026694176.1 uncharacterized protein LOC108950244 isoform X2 [Ciona intestinalis]